MISVERLFFFLRWSWSFSAFRRELQNIIACCGFVSSRYVSSEGGPLAGVEVYCEGVFEVFPGECLNLFWHCCGEEECLVLVYDA